MINITSNSDLGLKKKKKFQDSRLDDKLGINLFSWIGLVVALLCWDSSSTSMPTFLNVMKFLNGVNHRCCMYDTYRLLINTLTWSVSGARFAIWAAFALYRARNLEKLSSSSYLINSMSFSVIETSVLYEA